MPLKLEVPVAPLDDHVEVYADGPVDSESQPCGREGVELGAERSALRRWAAAARATSKSLVLDDPRADGHLPPPSHMEVFCSTLVIESVIGVIISLSWLLCGRWPPTGTEGLRWPNTICNVLTVVSLGPLSTFFASHDYELITRDWLAYHMACMITGMLIVRTPSSSSLARNRAADLVCDDRADTLPSSFARRRVEPHHTGWRARVWQRRTGLSTQHALTSRLPHPSPHAARRASARARTRTRRHLSASQASATTRALTWKPRLLCQHSDRRDSRVRVLHDSNITLMIYQCADALIFANRSLLDGWRPG